MLPPADIAFWPHTTDRGVASYRIRCALVIEGLSRLGAPGRLYAPGDPPPGVLVLSKRYDPASVVQAQALRESSGTRWVLDLCDNHFHYRQDQPVGSHLQSRSAHLVEAVHAADWVVTASQRLAEEVRTHCPNVRGISVIEDAVDDITTPAARSEKLALGERAHRLRQGLFFAWHPASPGRRLVWFGNHGFRHADGGMLELESLTDALNRHHARAPLSLTVISNSHRKFRRLQSAWRFPSLYLPWSNRLFAAVMPAHHVALVPVQANPVTVCKTNNRLVTAFALGVAVAAGSIPSYEEFRGLAVLDDWDDGLGTLMNDAEERALRVQRARQLIDSRYTVEVISREWAALGERLVRPDEGLESAP
ncbi:MAG: hypothetical protein H0U56_02320 [Methylibium sp.]|nr:hypothetical protein [Methylibium sp.]